MTFQQETTNRFGFHAASLALLMFLGMAFGLAVAADKNKEDNKEEVKKVGQGLGYWEKIDPNVDYKSRLPRIKPHTPDESMKSFKILPGLRLDLVASEPIVSDVVDMCFDENGRLYVCELISYAEDPPRPRGRVTILDDTDGDGRFDKNTIFADGLTWPTSALCFDGGIFLACAPDVLYLKDTDGDGKADHREVILTGFATHNVNNFPNSLRWGLDSRVQGMTATAGGKITSVKWNQNHQEHRVEEVEIRGRDFSFDPRTGRLWFESGGSQYGMTYDRWGRKFECNNSAPIQAVMYQERYLARNPYLRAPSALSNIWRTGTSVYRTSPVEPWRLLRTEMRQKGIFSGSGKEPAAGRFTSCCGVTIYKGDALPEAYHGNAFVCEGAGNLVHRMRLEPHGVGFGAYRTEEKSEFLTSTEIWFRPIQFAHAPDGTLYLADMYREVYEIPEAVPASVKKHIDLTTGNNRGRIYRIAPEGFKPPKPVHLGEESTDALVALLAHPNVWHRRAASRLLYQRQDPKAVGPLVQLANDSPSPLGRMHAMCALDGQGALPAEVVLTRLDDEHPRVREHAVRLAEKVLANAPAVREKLYTMVDDEDMGVRYQLSYTLGEIAGSKSTAALATLVRHDGEDRWMRLAFLSSSFGRAGELFERLAADAKWRATKRGRALLEELAEQAGLQGREDQVADVFKAIDALPDEENELAERVVHGLSKGLKASGSPLLARVSAVGKMAEVLAELIAKSKAVASDEEKPVDARVAAVQSLGSAGFEDVGEMLGELLASRQPQPVQMAALQALNRFKEPDVAEMVLDAWPGFSPQVRGAAAEALFARPDRVDALLDAVEDGIITPSQLDPARIEYLLKHPKAEVRARSEELLGSAKLARREEVVAGYRDVLAMKGDVARGKAVFKKECSTCHRLEGVGYDLGLPLTSVQNRGPEAILLATLDPNRDVQPQYLNYVAITDDGLSVTGMIHTETATSITLKRAEGESDIVLRTNLDELVNTGLSIMPEGLEKQLTKQDMSDVIAYLMSLK